MESYVCSLNKTLFHPASSLLFPLSPPRFWVTGLPDPLSEAPPPQRGPTPEDDWSHDQTDLRC